MKAKTKTPVTTKPVTKATKPVEVIPQNSPRAEKLLKKAQEHTRKVEERKKAEKEPKPITRIEATVITLKARPNKPLTISELVSEADKLYSKADATRSNPRESRTVVGFVVNTLTALGVLTRAEGDTVIYKP